MMKKSSFVEVDGVGAEVVEVETVEEGEVELLEVYSPDPEEGPVDVPGN